MSQLELEKKVVFYLLEQTPPINIGMISLVLLLQIIPQLNDALLPLKARAGEVRRLCNLPTT